MTRVLAIGLLLLIAESALAQTIEVKPLVELTTAAEHRLTALAMPRNDSWLAAELTARIATLPVEVGSQVERGQLLLELDDRDARLSERQAQASLRSAKAQAELAQQRVLRGEELIGRGFSSKDELLALQTQHSAAQAGVEIAKVALASAQRMLDKTRIRAPFAAVVVERRAQLGALATPGTPLLRLVDVQAPELEVQLPAALAEQIDPNGQAEFVTDSGRWPAQLLRLSPVLDGTSRTRLARFGFSAAAPRPGSSGQLVLQPTGSTLPAELLVQRDGQLGLFVAEQGQARFRPIAGAQAGRSVRVDWPSDTLIVSRGQQALQDGAALPAGSP